MHERAAWNLLTHMRKYLRTACVHTSMIYEDTHAPTDVSHKTCQNEQPKQYLTPVAEIFRYSLIGLMETFTPMELRFILI